MDYPIVFDLKLVRAAGAEAFCPDFSKEYKKPETIEAKKKEWLERDWEYSVAATTIAGIALPNLNDITTDVVTPATLPNVLSFVKAITAGDVPVVCEHFSTKASVLLAALFRFGGTADAEVSAKVIAMARKLYELRRRSLDMAFPFLGEKGNDAIPHVHNPIRALKLEDLTHAGLCAFTLLPLTATRLTIQRTLAHRIGITGVN